MLTNAVHVVCNGGMSDAELIDSMGGPATVARLLGIHDEHAAQRVSNWKKRGIPARVMLEHRLIFERARRTQAKAQANNQTQEA